MSEEDLPLIASRASISDESQITIDQKLDMLMGAMLAQQKLLTNVLLGFDSTLSKVIDEVNKKPKSIIQL